MSTFFIQDHYEKSTLLEALKEGAMWLAYAIRVCTYCGVQYNYNFELCGTESESVYRLWLKDIIDRNFILKTLPIFSYMDIPYRA